MECRIIACERVAFSGKAEGVYARSPEGWFGVLPGHAGAAFTLSDSPVRVITPEGTRTFHVKAGTLYVSREGVTVLADRAEADG